MITLLTASARSALRRYCRKLGAPTSIMTDSSATATSSSIMVKPRRTGRTFIMGSLPAALGSRARAGPAPLRIDCDGRHVRIGVAGRGRREYFHAVAHRGCHRADVRAGPGAQVVAGLRLRIAAVVLEAARRRGAGGEGEVGVLLRHVALL